MDKVEVAEVVVFTRVADGGDPLRCECDCIWYFRPTDLQSSCPVCGRGSTHGIRVSAVEYKNARKEEPTP